MKNSKLDEKDHRIIEILRKNSRSSIRSIAKEAGFRPSTVHQRIQRLVKSEIIEAFTLKLNNKALGRNFVVFMLVTSERILPKDAFESDCIEEVYGITGEHDLVVKMRFKDVEEFNSFILSYRKDYDLKRQAEFSKTKMEVSGETRRLPEI